MATKATAHPGPHKFAYDLTVPTDGENLTQPIVCDKSEV